MHKTFVPSAETPTRVYLFTSDDFAEMESEPFPGAKAIATANTFTGAAGQIAYGAVVDDKFSAVLYGLGSGRDALAVAGLSAKLPAGDYEIAQDGGFPLAHIAAGWADGAYRFDRYLSEPKLPPRLVIGEGASATAISEEAESAALTRDMVNTPACDMGPDNIQGVISELAERYGATLEVVTGDALLDMNYPLVHAVGRAADIAPRIVELSWGDESHPQLALVGKGVSFDSGGLNIKVSNGMRLMKKDMGGAAHVTGLARLIMAMNLPVYLKLYVPTVENAISGNAFRPGDVIKSRKGLTVEIDNTDAEGRLILADALAKACEDKPDLLIDFATLTGAARVALGPDLAPIYTDDDALAGDIETAAVQSGDPVWRMPLWAPYLKEMKSPIADLVNSGGGGMGGSITAGLFLKEFVDAPSWVHLDVWAWRLAKYGRPQGGAACGLRAVWAMLQNRYGD
jgi:leucyl aminopeptidase